MRDAAPPEALNQGLVAALAAVHLFALFLLPLWLLPRSPLWGLCLAVPVVLTPMLWSLTHEAIHGLLCRSARLNDRLGRLLGVLYGAPFQLLRLGHLMHHRFNRTRLNRVEVIEAATVSSLDRLRYYGRLLGGLYAAELLAACVAILPRQAADLGVRLTFEGTLEDGQGMGPVARRELLEEPGRSRMRQEGLAIVLGLALAFAAFGAHWWMLALALLGRAVLVSALDNVYHYGNPLDERGAGSDLRLPTPVRLLFLNFNFHGTHHQRPQVPWTALPDAFAALDRSFESSLGTALLRQLGGPLPQSTLPAADPRRGAPPVGIGGSGH